MRSRSSLFLMLAAFLLLITPAANGQEPPQASLGLYCTAGLQPDGYIDFTALPPAPNINAQPGLENIGPSTAVTATLPVVGVPGLTVTVTIPPIYNFSGLKSPAYSVDGGSLQLNGLPGAGSAGSPVALIFNFSQPIVGIGLNAETTGRFGYSYTLQAGSPSFPPAPPSPFATTSNGYTLRDFFPQTQSLQLVGLLKTVFQMADVQFEGSEYSTITLSNVRVRSASAPSLASAVPAAGLQQWLRADTTQTPFASGLWKDSSGNGHDATPSPYPPNFIADGRNCQAAFQFHGGQYFSFSLPIAGWSEMTVFLAAQAANDAGPQENNAAILWADDGPWNSTFVSPYQTHIAARFGTTQPANNLYYTRPGGGIGQDLTITRAVHDHDADSLYVNGLAVQNRVGKLVVLAGTDGTATIGKNFDGEISEILVYNRVLSSEEAELVESYLEQKYGPR